MKNPIKFIFAGIMLLVFAIGFMSCLRDSDDMKLQVDFVKSIDGNRIQWGKPLDVIITVSKECEVTMMIDSSIFDVSKFSKSKNYCLPTNSVGIHRMDVNISCGDELIDQGWLYEVYK